VSILDVGHRFWWWWWWRMLALLLIVVLGVCMDPEEGRRRGRGREGVHDVLQWRVRLEAQIED